MSEYTKKPDQFYEFSSKVGIAEINDMTIQFCDHVQKIDGTYYATAFYEGEVKDGKDDNGVVYQKISNANLAFIPQNLIAQAKAKYEDYNQTSDMIERLVHTVKELNERDYVRRAA
ncbi:MAG: hypothetical protein ACLFR0_08220 [Alphaproteobacteria bacterium]